MNQRSNKIKSLIALTISMLIFGTVGVFRRYVPLSSGLLSFCRGVIGALFLILVVKIKGGKLRQGINKRKLIWLAISGALNGINWMLLLEAYNNANVSTVTLCYCMASVIVILVSPIFFKEKLTLKNSLCALAAIVGMVFVSGVAESAPIAPSESKGILLGLGSALCYSMIMIINKKTPGIDAFNKTIIQMGFAAIVMIPYVLLTEDFRNIQPDIKVALAVLVMGLVHTGVAYALLFGSMDGLMAQTVAIFNYIGPVTALVLSAVILHERMTVLGIIGAVLILAATITSSLEFKKKAGD
ncbi:MAG: DMT family transporter [Lachnospiraceae bacterium]|jgi:RarD protein